MNFKEIYNKYNSCGILTDDELEYLIQEYSNLDQAVRDKACFLGTPTVCVVGIELRRLQDMRSARDYHKEQSK